MEREAAIRWSDTSCGRLIYSQTLDELAAGRTRLEGVEALEDTMISGCREVIAMAEQQADATEYE